MTWHDEFDGNKLDTTKWGYQYGCFDPAQRSQVNYTDSPENVSVQDGYLNLTARYSPTKTKWDGSQIARTCKDGSTVYDAPFTSGMITTKTKDGTVLYAAPGTGFYAEVRIKLPTARSSWSSFWATGTKGGWPGNGEIDIFESKGYDPSFLMSNIHTPRVGNPKKTQQHQGMMHGDTATSQSEFHTYGVLKTADAIEFYFDGQMTHRVKMQDMKGASNPFADPENNLVLKLNQMVGGSYLAKHDNWADKTFVDASKYADDYKSADGAASTMYVDYVRVYEPKTEADKPVEPAQPTQPTPAPETPTPAPTPEQPAQPEPTPAPSEPAQPEPTPSPEQPTPAQPSEPTPTPAPEQPAQPTPAPDQPVQPENPAPAPETPAQPEQPAPVPTPAPEKPKPVTPAPAKPTPAKPQPAQPSPAPSQPAPAPAQPQPEQNQQAEQAQSAQPDQPQKPKPQKPRPDRLANTGMTSWYRPVVVMWRSFCGWITSWWFW
jgi:beta-glucanase (GH16 family)